MVNVQYKKVLSESKNAIIATTYRDDYIVKGNSFSGETVREVTANLTEFFVLDPTLCDCGKIFMLPISVNASSGTVWVKLYEDTNSVGTDEVSFHNRNRLFTNVAKTTLKYVPSVGTVKGTLLFQLLFGGDSTNQNSGGGAEESANAFILDPTKKYLFEVLYSDAALIGYNLEMVEV